MVGPSLTLIDKGRAAKLVKLVENAKKKEHPDTYSIPWRGKREYLTVIRIETSWVLLNLDNGRTWAEQELRALQEGDPDLFADPLSDKAQKAQEAILRELDPVAFADLCRELEVRGQKEPAILTAAGVLINGNRRCVALRDIAEEYMSAIVLDDDATPKEIRALEFELQIAKDFREDYGDVNRLLLVERLMQEDGYDADSIARRLNMTKEEVQAEKGILELMREYIDVVKGSERLGNLKGKYQAFKELYALLNETRKNGQAEKAEKTKAARFIGIMGGAGYRELRAVDDKFAEQYLAPLFEREPDLKELVSSSEEAQVVDLGPLGAFSESADGQMDKGQVVLEKLVSIARTQPTVVVTASASGASRTATDVPGLGTGVPGTGGGVSRSSAGVPKAATDAPGPGASVPGPVVTVTGPGAGVSGTGASATGASVGVPAPSAGLSGNSAGTPRAATGILGTAGRGAQTPTPVFERARKAIQVATKDAAQDAKDEKNSGQPLVLLGEATNKLRRINLSKAKAAGSFNSQEFLKALAELQQAVDELEAKCKKIGDS